jgi:molybdopterin biosynthesis enzyme
MAGHSNIYRPREKAVLTHEFRHSADRTEFQRVVLIRRNDGTLSASSTGFQGSGRLLSMVGANGLVVLPHGRGNFEAGSVVDVLILDRVELE